MRKKHIDPVQEAWEKKHKQFPGVDYCVDFLFRRNTGGGLLEVICWELERYSKDHPDELIAIVSDPSHVGYMNSILLYVLIDIENPRTVPLFESILSSSREDLHSYAVKGLKKINSKESRTILWNYEKSRKRGFNA